MGGNEKAAGRARQGEARPFQDMRPPADAGALIPISGALDHLATRIGTGEPLKNIKAAARRFGELLSRSGAYCRRLHRHPAGAPHQIEFELDQLLGSVSVSLCTDSADACAQTTLQGAERLPFQPVKRITGGMPLGDGRAGKALIPILVMAIGARQVELTLSCRKQLASFGDK